MRKPYIQKRLAMVKILYEFGLSIDFIAETLFLTIPTVRNDLRLIREEGEAIKRLTDKNKNKIYQAVVKQYASFALKVEVTELEANEQAVYQCLQKWLNVDELIMHCNGMSLMMAQLICPNCPPDLEPYKSLLDKIFGFNQSCGCSVPTGINFWNNFIQLIVSEKIPIPTSKNDLLYQLVRMFDSTYRRDIIPPWQDNTRQIIDEQLATLPPREEDVVRRRFGLNRKRMSLGEVGRDYDVSRERIRQVEARALYKLRHPSRSKFLLPLVSSIEEIVKECLLLHRNQTGVLIRKASPAEQLITLEMLMRSTDELEVSVRTSNCLHNGNIRFIGDLIQVSEADLLRIKNFGHKSLNELKEILGEFGLSLGLPLDKIDPNLYSLFVKEKKKREEEQE